MSDANLHQCDPIATYRRLRAELEAATVTAETCAVLGAFFDAWEHGADLPAALGLVSDPARYSRNARHGLRLDDRDGALRSLAALATGSNWRRALAIDEWRDRLARGDSLKDLPAHTAELLTAIGSISPRQIHRVLSGNRSA